MQVERMGVARRRAEEKVVKRDQIAPCSCIRPVPETSEGLGTISLQTLLLARSFALEFVSQTNADKSALLEEARGKADIAKAVAEEVARKEQVGHCRCGRRSERV